MKSQERIHYLTRDGVLKLLSDDEAASVCNAESAEGLAVGEEYLDLTHLEDGVRHAEGEALDMGRVLPRNAVHEETWNKIVAVVDQASGRNAAL